jgi:dihydroneopterin aldolase
MENRQLFELDYIQFQDLKISVQLGVHEWEKHIQQHIMVDLKLFLSLENCQDKLENSLCYAQVSEALRQLCNNQHHELIETIAENIAKHCLNTYPIQAIEVIVKKFHVIHACHHVAVRILRFAK